MNDLGIAPSSALTRPLYAFGTGHPKRFARNICLRLIAKPLLKRLLALPIFTAFVVRLMEVDP